MTRFFFLERLDDGLVALLVTNRLRDEDVKQLWSLNSGMRKNAICSNCHNPIAKGEKAFSPLGFPFNRFERLHDKCVKEIEKAKG